MANSHRRPYGNMNSYTPQNGYDNNSPHQYSRYSPKNNDYRGSHSSASEIQKFISNFNSQSISFKNKDHIDFSTNPNGQGTPTVAIPKLYRPNVRPFELPRWFESFEELIECAEWDENKISRSIRLVLDKNIREACIGITDYEKIKKVIITSFFPLEDIFIYKDLLKNINTNLFDNVTDYYSMIKEIVKIVDFCLGDEQKMLPREIEDTFCQGLRGKYRNLFLTLPMLLLQDTATELDAINVRERLMNGPQTHSNEDRQRTGRHPRNGKGRKFAKKWCGYCRKNTHNEEDCFIKDPSKKRSYQRKEEKKENSKTYLIKGNHDLLTLGGSLGKENTQVEVIIDTASGKSLIRRNLVKDVPKIKLKEAFTLKAISSTLEITEKCEIDLTLFVLPNEKQKLELYIIDDFEDDIILGQDLIQKFDIITHSKARKVTWEGKEISLDDIEEADKSEPLDRICEMIPLGSEVKEPDTSKEADDKKIDKNEIAKIIEGYKNSEPNLGDIPNFEYEIKTKEPLRTRVNPYPIAAKSQVSLKEKVNSLLEEGVLAKSSEPFASPAFPRIKPSGDIRIVNNFFELNKKILPELFPMPAAEIILNQLGKKRVFANLDLSQGFYQIRLTEEASKLTSFVLPFGQYRYLRLPFGLSTAPQFFQRTMDTIFGDMENVYFYADDILIATVNEAEHLKTLREVIKRVTKNRIKLNIEKCKFLQDEVTYLG